MDVAVSTLLSPPQLGFWWAASDGESMAAAAATVTFLGRGCFVCFQCVTMI